MPKNEESDNETNHEKGERHEMDAKNILGRVYGAGSVDRVSRAGNNDPWRLADIMAVRPGFPVAIIQVKTNGVSDNELRSYGNAAMMRLPSSVRFEVWNRVDYEGWEMYTFDFDERAWYHYLDTPANREDAREMVAKAWPTPPDRGSLREDHFRRDSEPIAVVEAAKP